MDPTALRARAFCCALLASLALAAPATAQEPTANLAPPPEKFEMSPGGVDMRSGRYVYNQTDLAIGGGGLTLARTLAQPVFGHNNPFGNFSHNWDVLISEKRINVDQNIFNHSPGQPDYQIEVTFGGLSQTFRAFGPNGGPEQVSRSGFGQLLRSGSLANPGTVYTFRSGDGTEAVFRPIGSADCSSQLRCAYVARITEADGTRLDFQYDGAGGNGRRLRSVTSSRGYALLLEYSGMLVVKACVLNLAIVAKPADNVCPAAAPASASYTYTSILGVPKLAGATDPAGGSWGFTYAGPSMGFVRPGETAPWLTNLVRERMNDDGLIEEIIDHQSFADGSAYTYGFAESPLVAGHVPQIAGGSFVDSLGNGVSLAYAFPTRPYSPTQGHGNVSEGGPNDPPSPIQHQVTPGPVEITDPLGRVTTYDYCDPYVMANAPPGWLHRCSVMPVPVAVTDSEGIRTELAWDMVLRVVTRSRQIARPGSLQPDGQPWPDIVRSATYNCSPANFRFCTRPVTLTDARGAVTDYSYSAVHGGLLAETGPAPAPGAPRPQTRNDYAQRHAWISNGAGGHVQAATPVWLRVATSLCRTSAATGNPAAPCAIAGDEVRTAYEYGPDSGPNNLLLRGQAVTADGVALRTCYGYDALGRRIGETRPEADLGSCP